MEFIININQFNLNIKKIIFFVYITLFTNLFLIIEI
jgi:hypothetical protein